VEIGTGTACVVLTVAKIRKMRADQLVDRPRAHSLVALNPKEEIRPLYDALR